MSANLLAAAAVHAGTAVSLENGQVFMFFWTKTVRGLRLLSFTSTHVEKRSKIWFKGGTENEPKWLHKKTAQLLTFDLLSLFQVVCRFGFPVSGCRRVCCVSVGAGGAQPLSAAAGQPRWKGVGGEWLLLLLGFFSAGLDRWRFNFEQTLILTTLTIHELI